MTSKWSSIIALKQGRPPFNRERVQNVERVADVEALAHPTRARRSYVNAHALRRVLRADVVCGISG
jgi:hypothetical protein